MTRITRTLTATSLLLMATTATQADTILGIYAGVGSWNASPDGVFSSQGNNIDVESDLGFDSDQQNFLYAALEHPIPFLPNIKLSRTDLDNQASSTLQTDIEFENVTYSANENVNTTLDLTHTDVVAYYEILDNWVSLDIGLTARNFTGEASLRTDTLNEQVEIEAWIPLGYGKAQFELPFTGFYVGGEIHAIAFDDNGITDYSLRLGYESALRFGAELGYRKMTLELEDVDDANFNSDVNADGFYLSLTLHI